MWNGQPKQRESRKLGLFTKGNKSMVLSSFVLDIIVRLSAKGWQISLFHPTFVQS